jgi:hypothetical protein
MGKQAVFNMVAGAAIVAAPVAHIMSRYYCAVPPVSSPSCADAACFSGCATAGANWSARETLATGSGGEFMAPALECGALCCRQSLTFSLPTRPCAPSRAAQSLNPRSQHVERRQACGKPERMVRQVPRLVAGIARPQELRCVRVVLS